MTTVLEEACLAPSAEGDWRARVEAALGGQPFDTLVSVTEDGVRYGPIYPGRRPAVPIPHADPAVPWKVVQRVDDPVSERANGQALADLAGGATGLSLVFQGSPTSRGFGVALDEAAIERALTGVIVDIVGIRLEPHPDPLPRVAMLKRLALRRGLAFETLDLDLGLDPIGCLAFSGIVPERDQVLGVVRDLLSTGFFGRILEADGRVYHEAGASLGQELGATLATAVHYLRKLEPLGLDVAASAIGFTLAADQKQFLVTAKMRALRLLWRRVLDLSGLATPSAVRLHVETSYRMMTARDPDTNILRAAIAAFAAASGGADSISVLPHTLVHGLPEAKARRLARNTQVLLLEETGLGRVADPAAGSGGLEAVTDGLAEAGWAEFQRIEAEGGILRSLVAQSLQLRVMAVRQARLAAVADGREPIVGVTLYPGEAREVAVLMPRDETAGVETASGGGMPLLPHRLSAIVEAGA